MYSIVGLAGLKLWEFPVLEDCFSRDFRVSLGGTGLMQVLFKLS